MKVFVIFDEASAPAAVHHKLAITLPPKWMDQSVDKVKGAFIGAYNKKFADSPLVADEMLLQVPDNSPFTHADTRLLRTTDTPEKAFEDKAEVRVVHRPVATAARDNGATVCKNYGCQCEFDESNNHEAACRYHRSAPMFHDTRKWWSCCEATKVYSFDELYLVPGCQIGPHSSRPPPEEQKRTAALADATKQALKLHEGVAKPTATGRAPPPKQVFTPSASTERKRALRPPLAAGRARCKHYGCQNEFVIAYNHATACTYHAAAPYFHEGSKQWPCCGVKKWDFDEFLAVPGCKRGWHEVEDEEATE
eukprot:CAMPEP_0119374518 /NCGR_PEP_ID=MMETSP1334-20130426/30842_1 /TAXON_ID=127549 /ORGANISM="Calcidiscus leptoporus, Strain RCC1130" /LENGTH=307 /DNA_ID=CAMNT_0007392599 /DNA_START=54 /DNA_END=977 /DNA_ORIENTATION=-